MKVLNLACTFGHGFEGWFDSDQEFDHQRARGVLECPICCDRHIEKRPSAPRLHLTRRSPVVEPGAEVQDAPRSDAESEVIDDASRHLRLRSAWLALALHLKQHSEDVGSRFAEEARDMHRGDAVVRPIHGNATAAEATALIEEGLPVLPLPDTMLQGGPLH